MLGSWMTTCVGKCCSFGLPRVLFVNCCQFVYLFISLLVLRAGCGIWLHQFLIIAYRFTLLNMCTGPSSIPTSVHFKEWLCLKLNRIMTIRIDQKYDYCSLDIYYESCRYSIHLRKSITWREAQRGAFYFYLLYIIKHWIFYVANSEKLSLIV